MRRILIAGVSVVALAGAGPAVAAPKKQPTLAVTSVQSHHGARIGPAERFRVTGTLRNRGHSASQALLTAGLRTRAGKTAFVLGAKNIQRVRGRHSRKFTITATGPLLPAGSAAKRYVLVACVRSRRGARATCRRLKRTVVVVAPATGTGTGNGSPGPGGTTPPPVGPEGVNFTAGARSVGDRLFPQIGNGGYDVTHYDLVLAYDPATDLLQGTATIEARATQNLSELSLDLHNMPASSVLVDGRKAGFAQPPGKLVVTPQAGIPSGTTFTTTVTYASPIVPYTDPDGSREGWVPTSDGAFVVNEPVGSMSWFPNNNVPTDKATYDLRVTVPGSLEVIGNGLLVSDTVAADGRRTWHWREDSPMATYLVTATNGQFDVTTDTSNAQRPTWYALDSSYTPVQKAAMSSRLTKTPGILDFFAAFLATPYPFSSAGGIVDRSNVGYALETQSKPNYAVNLQADPASPGEDTISHELAHQWFGDLVSPATWSDVWLNEGPAEFFSWLWQERASGTPGPTTEQRFDTNYASPAMSWSTPPAAPPTAADMFDVDAMYNRGAMVMEALRQIMGEERFKAVLAKYLASHQYGNSSTQQFIDLVKSDSGKDPGKLEVFFREWLYGTKKPGITPDNFETYTAP